MAQSERSQVRTISRGKPMRQSDRRSLEYTDVMSGAKEIKKYRKEVEKDEVAELKTARRESKKNAKSGRKR